MKRAISLPTAAVVVAGLAAVAEPAQAQVYLRADAGYGWNTSANLKDRNGSGDFNCTVCSADTLTEVGASPVVGGGIGYRFSDLLRADVSVGYRGWSQLNQTNGAGTKFKSDIRSLSVMATGYVDLPVEWHGVRPYVGAGIGWANNRMGTITQTFDSSFGSESDPSGSHNSLAWLATAGLSVAVSGPWSIDLAYRYVDLGKIKTEAGTSALTFGAVTMPLATNGVMGDLSTNEVLLSVRYTF
jgi:opacity protein-like surface antigen